MSVIGLDIGSHSIKAVQLEKTGDKFALLAAGITPSPAGGLTGDTELVKTAAAIKKLTLDAKMTTKNVNLSLAESGVFTRMMTLPPLTSEEVSSAVRWQAEPYIPIPIEEAVIDYQIVSQTAGEGGTGKVEVLLVATPKKLVNRYVELAELAGLMPQNIETELLALTRACAPAAGAALIVDFGATSTDLAIVQNGQLLATRSMATAGEVLTRSVAASLSVVPQQAEEYKKAYGLSAALEGKVRAALEPTLALIVDEMKKAIGYYQQELGRTEEIKLVILAGGSAGLAEMVPYLAEKVGLEVSVADPTVHLVKDVKLSQDFLAASPLYAVAIGLALND